MKKSSPILFIALACILLTAGSMFYARGKSLKRKHIESLTIVTAAELVEKFHQNKTTANKVFLNKLLLIKGTVDTLETNYDGQIVAVLSGIGHAPAVRCILRDNSILKIGKEVTLKGLCTGFPDDVMMIDCVLSEQ